MQAINTVLNSIHEWGEPEAHPLKRIFLTRLTTIGVVGLEVLGIVEATYDFAKQTCLSLKNLMGRCVSIVFPTLPGFQDFTTQRCNYQGIGRSLLLICKLIVGLTSTILIGIIFSPEINFRIHLRMGLAVDNLAVIKQRDLAAKLKAEAQALELAKTRTARFEKFQAEQRAAKEDGKPNPIDEHLAELLVPGLAAEGKKSFIPVLPRK